MSRTYPLRHFSLPLIVFLLSLILAACGGGEDESVTIPDRLYYRGESRADIAQEYVADLVRMVLSAGQFGGPRR